MNLAAFTLAEVLITLAIIGVVAALTIPTVVRNYQKQQTIVKLKKTFSALANTTNLAIADNGPVETWDVSLTNDKNSSIQFAKTYMLPYLKVSDTCETKTTGACEITGKYLNGGSLADFTNFKFLLNDGTSISLLADNTGNYRKIITIVADINGMKQPNVMGKDQFYFQYLIRHPNPRVSPSVGKIVPYGAELDRETLRRYYCAKGKNGNTCAAMIMKDGWKISDDYPW